MSEWISVDDRLPECKFECNESFSLVSNSVLVCDKNDLPSCGIGHCHYDGGWTVYCGEYDFMNPGSVTHWMPLPDAPK